MKDWMAVASWAGLTDLEVLESPHAGVFRMFAQGLMDLRESLGALSCVAEEDEHEEKHRRREREQSELKGRVDLMMLSEARRCDGAAAVEKSQHDVIAVVERLKDMVDIQKNHMDRAIGLIRKIEAARRSTHAEMLSRIAKLGKRMDLHVHKRYDSVAEVAEMVKDLSAPEQPDREEQIHISVDMKLLDGEPDHDQHVKVQDPWGRRLWIPANWLARGEDR